MKTKKALYVAPVLIFVLLMASARSQDAAVESATETTATAEVPATTEVQTSTAEAVDPGPSQQEVIDQLTAESKAKDASIAALREQLEAAIKSKESMVAKEELLKQQEATKLAQAELAKAQSELATARAEIEATKKQLAESNAQAKTQQEALASAAAQAKTQREAHAAALAQPASEKEALTSQLNGTNDELAAQKVSFQALTEEKNQIAQARANLDADRVRLEGELVASQEANIELDEKVAQLRAQIPKGLVPTIVQGVFGSPCRNRVR